VPLRIPLCALPAATCHTYHHHRLPAAWRTFCMHGSWADYSSCHADVALLMPLHLHGQTLLPSERCVRRALASLHSGREMAVARLLLQRFTYYGDGDGS